MYVNAINEKIIENGIHELFNLEGKDLKKISYHISELIIDEEANNNGYKEYAYHKIRLISKIFIHSIISKIIEIVFNITIKDDSTDIVVISAGSTIDRFKNDLNKLFGKWNYNEFVYLTGNSIKSILNNKNAEYIVVNHLHLKAFYYGFIYLVKKRKKLFKNLEKEGGKLNKNIKSKIDKYIIRLIFDNVWAERYAFKLVKRTKAKIYLFDLDTGRKYLMLANSLNRLNQKTVLLQHGILTDPNLYLPTCKYMLCCSKRAYKRLVEKGVDSERLFIVGSPLQAIVKKHNTKLKKEYNYNFMVIASGIIPYGKTKHYIKTINAYKYSNTLFRLHPRSTKKINNMWRMNFKKYYFNNSIGIQRQILSAQIIITCSLDALIKCLYMNKRTICVLSENEYRDEKFRFLQKINGLLVSYDEKSHLKNIEYAQQNDYEKLIDKEQLHDFFGEDNSEKVLQNIRYSLKEINKLNI